MGEAAATPHRPSDARLPHLQAHIAGTPARALLRVCMMVDLLVQLYYCTGMAVWLSEYARRSVSYWENYSDGTQRSVSYGEDTVRLLYMVHVLYGYCLLYASDLSRRSMHGKMAGLVTVW